MLTFNKRYAGFAIILFITEVLIALFVRDKFVRPYFGDVLVVILVYCFIRAFLKVEVLPLAVGVLIFSFTIEYLQYLNFINWLELEKSAVANAVLGNSFAWKDIVAYMAGILIILLVENYRIIKRRHLYGRFRG